MQRNNRRVIEGIVIKNKMDKTVVVEVIHKMRHPIYEKLVMRRKKYYAHDAKNSLEVGQKVRLMQSKPYSKLKRWRVAEVIQPSSSEKEGK